MFSFLKPEHISLMSTMLPILGGLTACVRYLLKVAWRLKLDADKAKDELAKMRIADLQKAIDEHGSRLNEHVKVVKEFENQMTTFATRLNSNRDAADAAVSSLKAFVNATEERFKELETKLEQNFGKVIVKQ